MQLKTGGWFVVLKVGREAAGEKGAEQVVVFNPKVPQANLFPVEKEKFLAHWTGEIVLLKRIYKAGEDKPRKFAFPGSARNSGASARCCAMW